MLLIIRYWYVMFVTGYLPLLIGGRCWMAAAPRDILRRGSSKSALFPSFGTLLLMPGPLPLAQFPWGRCAIKAEGVCQVVLPGVRTCVRFEEGILYVWRGEVGRPPIGLGAKGVGSKTCEKWAARLANSSSRGKLLLLVTMGGLSLRFTSAASAPRRPSHAGAGDASHSVIPKTVKFGGCSRPHLMWELPNRAAGFRITHRWCAACSGILLVVLGFSALAVCQFAPPRPFGGASEVTPPRGPSLVPIVCSP